QVYGERVLLLVHVRGRGRPRVTATERLRAARSTKEEAQRRPNDPTQPKRAHLSIPIIRTYQPKPTRASLPPGLLRSEVQPNSYQHPTQHTSARPNRTPT
ncbi:unnamed protein product, partial [Ectocarpus sp. 12 AP-2014]